MANQEQLEILKQGVEVWNQWRKEHPDEKIDLSGANLNGSTLCGADLDEANLCEADLREADLSGADLGGAGLGRAILRGAILFGANQRWANQSWVRLNATRLRATRLRVADLTGANLFGANLLGADLTGANLREADLTGAKLIQTNLCQTTLTGAKLYGTARDDWQIEEVECEYVVWDNMPLFISPNGVEKQKQWEAEHRFPKDRDFSPGEFKELYKQLPTFVYAFEYGFTPLDVMVMDRIVQAINERHPEFELKLDSFQSRGQPHAKFTVLHKENVEAAQTQVAAQYEQRILRLEAQKDQLMDVIKMLGSGGVKLQAVTDGGITIRPALSAAVTQAIVAFLVTLPNIQNAHSQEAFLHSAGLDAALRAQLHVGEPPKNFMELLVSACVSYGQMADGRPALIAVLEAAQQVVGADRQAKAEELIRQITHAFRE